MINQLLDLIYLDRDFIPRLKWGRGASSQDVPIYFAVRELTLGIHINRMNPFSVKINGVSTLIFEYDPLFDLIDKNIEACEMDLLTTLCLHHNFYLSHMRVNSMSRHEKIKLAVPNPDEYLKDPEISKLIFLAVANNRKRD